MNTYKDLLNLHGKEFANQEIKKTFETELIETLLTHGVNESDLQKKFEEIIINELNSKLIFSVTINGVNTIILEI